MRIIFVTLVNFQPNLLRDLTCTYKLTLAFLYNTNWGLNWIRAFQEELFQRIRLRAILTAFSYNLKLPVYFVYIRSNK